jgi:hypothetical protein
MSGKGEVSPIHLPVHISVIIVLCACSLAVHFSLKGMIPASGQFTVELTDQGGHPHPVDQDCEDAFVYSSSPLTAIEYTIGLPESQTPIRSLAVHISPLLPPPNL